MNSAVVSIIIPTKNSGRFLEKSLKSIKNQRYKNIEIIVVDGASVDNTLDIARKYKARIYNYEKALLGARELGCDVAKGKYLLYLDSDQILLPDTIVNSVKLIELENKDMLFLEEDVYSDKNFIEKLFKYDRKLINEVKDFSPYTGVMLPRFFRKSLLVKTFNKIDNKTKEGVGGQDHAILYYEAWKISKKVGYVPNAVKHIEPNSLHVIFRKFYRWGYTSLDARYGKYDEFLGKKEKFRTGLFKNGLIKESIGSVLLLLIKGIPFKFGVMRAKLDKKLINYDN